MTRERVSALVVAMDDGWGIVTDRDLRARALAAGRSPDETVVEVASTPLVTMGDDATVGECWRSCSSDGSTTSPSRGTAASFLAW
jgi:CBS domain-containing protein